MVIDLIYVVSRGSGREDPAIAARQLSVMGETLPVIELSVLDVAKVKPGRRSRELTQGEKAADRFRTLGCGSGKTAGQEADVRDRAFAIGALLMSQARAIVTERRR